MHHTKILALSIFVLGIYTHSNSMETVSWSQELSLPQLNQQATLIYEQAFFCELLLAIFCRRTDQFHVDVARARDKVIEMAVQAWDKPDKLKFDFDRYSPLHERVAITKLYYAFKYLIRQETYESLKKVSTPTEDLTHLNSLMSLLKRFEQAKQQRQGLQYISEHQAEILQIIHLYKYDCDNVRGKYQEIIDELRDQVVNNPNNIEYILHAYLKRPAKILPAYLHSDEYTLPNVNDSQYNPLFNVSFSMFSQSFMNLPWDDEELDTGKEQAYEKSLVIGDLLYSCDFQEYWLAHVADSLQDPDELILVARNFVNPYMDGLTKIKHAAPQMQRIPELHTNIGQSLALLPTLSKNLFALSRQTPFDETSLYVSALTKTIGSSLLTRYTSSHS